MEYRLGIDIGGTKIAIGLVNENGKLEHQEKFSTHETITSHDEAVPRLTELITNYCDRQVLGLTRIRSVGIGVPGVIDRSVQTITSCPNLSALDNLDLGPRLSRALRTPVWVENDVNLIALGEHHYGRGQGLTDVAYIFVGTGIGCGLILDRKLYAGSIGAAGEFGHMTIVPDGLVCGCGNRGCLEMYCSGKALTLKAIEASGQANRRWKNAFDLICAGNEGDPVAQSILAESFHYLGLGIANLVNLLNPAMVVLGGGILTGWPAGLQTVQEVLKSSLRELFLRKLQIEYPLLGEKAGLLGAAAYARSNERY